MGPSPLNNPTPTPTPTSDPSASRADPGYSQWLGEQLLTPSDPQIVQLAQKIIANQPTTMDQITAIHDWVISHIQYDFQGVANHTESYQNSAASHVLSSGVAICDGYASITASLLLAAGIPAKIVTGTYSGPTGEKSPVDGQPCNHAWDKAEVNGQWIVIDTTFDATWYKAGYGFAGSRKYLNPPEAFLDKDHQECSESSGN